MAARLLDLGDTALTVEFGAHIGAEPLARVAALECACRAAIAAGRLAGVIETVPTFRSLTVHFDPLATSAAELAPELEALAAAAGTTEPPAGRRWLLPACYEGEATPDLAEVARAAGCTPDEVVDLHIGTDYVVYMLGFLPGFAFLGDVPERLRLPRRAEPRQRVPAGSVAIATQLTAIYPWESPGGWHLIGRSPAPLFDARRARPALLEPGDRVRFEPVDAAEWRRLDAAVAAGELDPAVWCRDDGAPAAPPDRKRSLPGGNRPQHGADLPLPDANGGAQQ